MIGVPGGCTVCDKPIVDGGRPTQDHTQVEVTWSNGSKMTVGVCRDCATSHKWASDEGKKAIQTWHWTFWDAHRANYDKGITLV